MPVNTRYITPPAVHPLTVQDKELSAQGDASDTQCSKLQAPVYNILPPTTAIIDYTIGLGNDALVVLKQQ